MTRSPRGSTPSATPTMTPTPPRLHFVYDHVEMKGLRDWLGVYTKGMERWNGPEAVVTRHPEEATFIVFCEYGRKRGRFFLRNRLLSHPLYRRFPGRCFIWSTEDRPVDYLPGLYASLPRGRFDRRRHRAFGYFRIPTEDEPAPPTVAGRDLLYNFVGGPTSALRRQLYELAHPDNALVRETANFNHGNRSTEEIRRDYLGVLARSRFTLCPRGVGTSSYRLFESMRMGSVPVILADELVVPDGPDWESMSVRVQEKEVGRLPEMLAERSDEAEEMGRRARATYERFFAPERRPATVATLLAGLSEVGPRRARLSFYTQQAVDLAGRAWGRVAGGGG